MATFSFFGGDGTALPPNVRVATTSPVVVDIDDDIIIVRLAVPGAVAVTLPAIDDHTTKKVTIKDGTGDAFINNITTTPNGAETIDGAGTHVLVQNYAAANYVGAGTEWSVT